jgi:hypothetical protein
MHAPTAFLSCSVACPPVTSPVRHTAVHTLDRMAVNRSRKARAARRRNRRMDRGEHDLSDQQWTALKSFGSPTQPSAPTSGGRPGRARGKHRWLPRTQESRRSPGVQPTAPPRPPLERWASFQRIVQRLCSSSGCNPLSPVRLREDGRDQLRPQLLHHVDHDLLQLE